MSYFEWRAKSLLAREARNWLIHLTSGRATTDDADAFRRWYQTSPQHNAAFDEVKRLWRQLEPAMRAAPVVAPTTARRDRTPAPNWGRRALLGAAAASVGAFVLKPGFFLNPEASWLSLQGLTSDFQTATGEQKNILLKGNVSVEMNTLTRIDLRAAGIDLMTGEAQVRAQAMSIPQLVVYANGGEVHASKADFNIRNVDSQVSVTCLAGEVSVICNAVKRELLAGQQLTYTASGLGNVVQANTEQVSAWRQRLLIFNHQPLSHVIEEINRYRPGKIILLNSQLGQRLVQARFNLDQLESVASLIRDAYGAKVTNFPGGIVVLS
jgi:ferric-dicitrate binding protein FerR (iron transport regulator)